MPMPGHDTLQEAIHALVTEPSAEIYGVFNASSAGKMLQDHADVLNYEMQS